MLNRHSIAGLLGLLMCGALAAPARAADPPDPLRLIPVGADVVLKVEHPRQFVEAFTTQPALKQLLAFDAARDALDTASVRRFFQVLAYYERELGAAWPDLLDQTAGGGIALAAQIAAEQKDNKLLLVVQAKDEKQLRKLFELVQHVVEEELDRQEAKIKFQKAEFRGVPGVKLGTDFFAAVAGSALFVANKADVMDAAIERHQGKAGASVAESKSLQEARKLVGPDALAWLWGDLTKVKQAPKAKDVFAQPGNDQNVTVLFGGWIDIVRRAEYVTAGFYREKDGLRLSVRLPAGRSDMPEQFALHLPKAGTLGSLPHLEPQGVLFSSSYYFDFAALWEQRAKLFPPQIAKAFDDFDKQGSRFTLGTSVSKLFLQSGPYQRVVVAQPSKPQYKTEPGTKVPAFAVVLSMRDDKFGESLNAVLRAAGLLALGGQVKMSLVEEKVGDVTLAGYRFDESAPFPNNADPTGIRFNFTPCFAKVGDQFFVASTLDLGRELIGLLKQTPAEPAAAATTRMRLYGTGGAAALRAAEDQLLTQAILGQAVPADVARKEIAALLKYLEGLGQVRIEANYRDDSFRLDVRWQAK
jgi:hypothetical protein